jgi:hypothetical protein
MIPYFNGSFLTGVRKGSDDDNTVDRHISNLIETEKWWGLDSLGKGPQEKRVDAFKRAMYLFNQDLYDSWSLPLDHEEGGLRILHKTNGSPKKELYRLWRSNNCPKPRTFGCEKNPLTMSPWKLVQAVLSPKPDEKGLQMEFAEFLKQKHIDFRMKTCLTKTAKLVHKESLKILSREWITEPERELRERYRWSY